MVDVSGHRQRTDRRPRVEESRRVRQLVTDVPEHGGERQSTRARFALVRSTAVAARVDALALRALAQGPHVQQARPPFGSPAALETRGTKNCCPSRAQHLDDRLSLGSAQALVPGAVSEQLDVGEDLVDD
jgi:hypothetical protein